jgi:hypothetical protein
MRYVDCGGRIWASDLRVMSLMATGPTGGWKRRGGRAMEPSEIDRRVRDAVSRALGQFSMLRAGDRVAVGSPAGRTASASSMRWWPISAARRFPTRSSP